MAENGFVPDISEKPAPAFVDVSYDGVTIALLLEGMATLHCAGKRMKTDVMVLCSELTGSVTYKGTTTEVEAGQTATLHCAGKVMEDDVVIRRI